jgi:uncharacterized protein (DUF1800 family)
VRRLFWRAGFGATPAEARRWAARGRAATLQHVLAPDGTRAPLTGPAGMAIDPQASYGFDALWWLDRMVRTAWPLQEKIALFWHDHFATREQYWPMMLRQNELFRTGGLGTFDDLAYGILEDPAMGTWLNLIGSYKADPNENFARELMELFTLGEGDGYTETDVREAARALTGYVRREPSGVLENVDFQTSRHDAGAKTIFGQTDTFGPRDVVRLCMEHPGHAPFLMRKLWAFFIDEPLDAATLAALQRIYVDGGRAIRPVVAAILDHPALYASLDSPGMVKCPAVFLAGMLRATGTPVAIPDWSWQIRDMGQQLFWPPSVAGWEWGAPWVSSNGMRSRFAAAGTMLRTSRCAVADGSTPLGLSPEAHLERALDAVGRPWASNATRGRLLDLARRYADLGAARGQDRSAADMTQRALRHLLLAGPDNQLH